MHNDRRFAPRMRERAFRTRSRARDTQLLSIATCGRASRVHRSRSRHFCMAECIAREGMQHGPDIIVVAAGWGTNPRR